MQEDNTKKQPAPLHLLPLKSKKGVLNLPTPPLPKGGDPDSPTLKKGGQGGFSDEKTDFSRLAERLEKKIGRIETEFRDSITLLNRDIRDLLHQKNVAFDEKTVQAELNALYGQLEARMQKTVEELSRREAGKREDKDAVRVIKDKTAQLTRLLSLDFYKSVLGRLTSAEHEEEVDPFGMDYRLVEKIKPLFDFLYSKYWRVSVTGIANIPNEGKALIVANHSGTMPYDGAMIKTAILNEHPKRKDARFLVEDFVYHMPILGTFMYRIGGVRACPENAELLLNAGHLVIVFPEGVKGIGKLYRERYKLQRFGRGGFIKLCMKTGAPLVPVGVVGAEEIHPIMMKSNILAKTIGVPYIPITPTFPLLGLLGCVPLPSKWFIHFGEPIRLDSYGPKAMDDELLVHKLSEKVRMNIQEIIFDLLRKRRSVWLG
ncbi:MAG: acyltransferase family protein [Deltaproteobacteria bacterium]|nr:acyltransferase family protein [Deltaproteobacteria bacterium]